MWTRRPLCTGSWLTWWRPTVLTYSASTIQTYLGEPLTFMSCISNNVSHPYLLCTCIQIRIPNPVSKFVFQIRIRIQKAVEHGINNGSKSCACVPETELISPIFQCSGSGPLLPFLSCIVQIHMGVVLSRDKFL